MKTMFAGLTEILAAILMLVCYQSCFAADQFEKPEHINEVVKNFLAQNIQTAPDETLEIKVNQSNAPLNVPVCASDISAAYPADANREQLSSVQLSCNDAKPWQIVVPVDVQVFSKVLVAKHTIAAKETISDEDVDYTVYNKNHLYNGFFTRKEDVIGSQAAYLVPAGTVLTKKNMQQPLLITRNQTITIVAQSNSIVVSMQGIARTDGALNAMIKVYNPSSKRTLDAIVIGPNKAQVTG